MREKELRRIMRVVPLPLLSMVVQFEDDRVALVDFSDVPPGEGSSSGCGTAATLSGPGSRIMGARSLGPTGSTYAPTPCTYPRRPSAKAVR